MTDDERPSGTFSKEVAVTGAQIARSLTLATPRPTNPIWSAELEELLANLPAEQGTMICAVICSLCIALGTAVSLAIDPSGESVDPDNRREAIIDILFRNIAELN